jgi:N-methylhydantoinase A
VVHEDAIDLPAIAAIYAGLEHDAVATLERDGIARERIRLLREADMRYAGQSMEVRVSAPAGAIDGAFVVALLDAFHAAHRKTFGYSYAGQQKVELVNFCVSGLGLIDRPRIPTLAPEADAPPQPPRRPVYFDRAFRDTPVYQRESLPPGWRGDGPLVIEEFGSTTVVFPGQSMQVDPHGILVIRPARRPPEVPQ